jgi:hypothetical protein
MSLLGGDKGLSALIGAGFRRLQSYMVTLIPFFFILGRYLTPLP